MIVLPWLVAFGSFLTLFAIIRIERFTMSEVQDAVDAVTAQVVKARDEVVKAIADLEAREPSVDLTALKAAVQSVDDIVPDPVPDPAPVEDAPVDVPPVDVPPVDVPPAE